MEQKNSVSSGAQTASLNGTNALCHKLIELIQFSRDIAVRQIHPVQLMSYYALGRWIAEEQQSGGSSQALGKRAFRLSQAGFRESSARDFRQIHSKMRENSICAIRDGFPRQSFGNSPGKNAKRCAGIQRSLFPSDCPGRTTCCSCASGTRKSAGSTKSRRQNRRGVCGRCNDSTSPACTRGSGSAGTRMRYCAWPGRGLCAISRQRVPDNLMFWNFWGWKNR